MIVFGFLVLKGRNILAQGKRRRSIALGWRTGIKIVRVNTFIKEKILFRTKQRISCFPKNDVLLFRPKQRYLSVQHFCTDGFSPVSLTQGGVSDRSSRNYALG
jgi:hypothetical protein